MLLTPKSFAMRTMYALTKVRARTVKDDLLLKTFTFANSVIKLLRLWRPDYAKMRKWPLKKWFLNDCMVKVNFLDIQYVFLISKGYDFVNYLNPYFHEYDVACLVYSLLRENDIFVDVGAHAGLYTLIAGRRVGANGVVVSIEPNPENIAFLELNIQLNRIKSVHIAPQAVGETSGHIKMCYPPGNTGLTSVYSDNRPRKALECFEAEITTLDEIYEMMLKPRSVRMIKIDTEGFDLHVLKGANGILKRTHYVIMEENVDEVRRYLDRCGFRFRTIRPSNYLLATNLRIDGIKS
jgi:FkbM family methyltransferase